MIRQEEAVRLHEAGLCVMPVTDRKVPLIKQWQKAQFQFSDLKFNTKYFGIVCGQPSQGLEVIDVDTKVLKQELVDGFKEKFLKNIPNLEHLAVYETMSGGLHILYKCDAIAGNMKLARPYPDEAKNNSNEALIETRGKGGYVVAYPNKHVAGPTYETLNTITEDQRNQLIEHCRNIGYKQPAKKLRKRTAKRLKYKGLSLVSTIKDTVQISDVIAAEFKIWPDSSGKWLNVLRHESTAQTSGKIFLNNKTGQSLYLHSTGTQYPAEQMLDVIEILAIQNNCDDSDIIAGFKDQLLRKEGQNV